MVPDYLLCSYFLAKSQMLSPIMENLKHATSTLLSAVRMDFSMAMNRELNPYSKEFVACFGAYYCYVVEINLQFVLMYLVIVQNCFPARHHILRYPWHC